MKLKRVRIVVEPLPHTHARWKKALARKSVSKEEVITVASWEVLGKVLAPPRLEILARIATRRPKSIAVLARSLKRDFKNVYADVLLLADLGLIELKEAGSRKTLMPIPRFAGIEVDLGVASGRPSTSTSTSTVWWFRGSSSGKRTAGGAACRHRPTGKLRGCWVRSGGGSCGWSGAVASSGSVRAPRRTRAASAGGGPTRGGGAGDRRQRGNDGVTG